MDPIDELVEKMKAVDKTRCLFCKGTGFVTARLAPSGTHVYECPACDPIVPSSSMTPTEKKP